MNQALELIIELPGHMPEVLIPLARCIMKVRLEEIGLQAMTSQMS
jgi:hypothetical protein